MTDSGTLEARRSHGDGCECTRCTGTQPGNDLAVTHGAHVADERLVNDPAVEAWVGWILGTQAVSHPADRGAAIRLALVYVRLERSSAALNEADAAAGDHPGVAYTDKATWLGRLREDHARWLREAGRIEAELARTPASRAKLGLHIAQGRRALSLVELHEAAALEDAEESA